jgi:hypothetical protein
VTALELRRGVGTPHTGIGFVTVSDEEARTSQQNCFAGHSGGERK